MGLGDSPPPLCRHIRHTHTHTTRTHTNTPDRSHTLLVCLCAGQKCCCGTRAHVERGEKNNPRKYQMEEFLAESVANEEPKEPKEREREREREQTPRARDAPDGSK